MAEKQKRRKIRHLPEEIVEEILYKLPIKSLLRFNCVSKSWRSIISSKAFIKEHLNRSIAKDATSGLSNLTHHKLLFTYKYIEQNQRKISFGLGSNSLIGNEPTLYDNPMPIGFLLMGSCNGMILMRYNNTQIGPLVLWNPSTRKHRVIRSPSFDPIPQEDYFRMQFYNFIYGLGYDESNDEYKVVCIRDAYLPEPNHYQTQMYSSKTDSWKKIESFNKRFQIIYCGKFLNGRLHWLAEFDSINSRRCEIISLDLVEEKYQTLSSYCFDQPCRSALLVELGGYLGLTIFGHLDWDMNVWVMKEYGVRESWTKIWTLTDFVDDPRKRLTTPLCWRQNGDIVVVCGDDVLVCNGKNLLSKSRVCMLRDRLHSIIYVESLVSPLIDEH